MNIHIIRWNYLTKDCRVFSWSRQKLSMRGVNPKHFPDQVFTSLETIFCFPVLNSCTRWRCRHHHGRKNVLNSVKQELSPLRLVPAPETTHHAESAVLLGWWNPTSFLKHQWHQGGTLECLTRTSGCEMPSCGLILTHTTACCLWRWLTTSSEDLCSWSKKFVCSTRFWDPVVWHEPLARHPGHPCLLADTLQVNVAAYDFFICSICSTGKKCHTAKKKSYNKDRILNVWKM